MKICKKENCNNPVFGKGYCRNHQYLREDQKQKQEKKFAKSKKHELFYVSVWQKNAHECYECGTHLAYYDKKFIHHVVGKRHQPFYPNIDLDEDWNGILLCWVHHDQVELNIDKTPKVKMLTETLKEKISGFYQP